MALRLRKGTQPLILGRHVTRHDANVQSNPHQVQLLAWLSKSLASQKRRLMNYVDGNMQDFKKQQAMSQTRFQFLKSQTYT